MLRKKRALSSKLVQRQKGEYKLPFENDSLEIMLVERQKGEYKYELLKAPDFCENSNKFYHFRKAITVIL